VSRNAIKHGILAREVVITAGDGEESLKEFHDLLEKFWEQYEPVGVVEELLVEKIATCWWRKARVLRAENGEIRKRLDAAAKDREIRNAEKVTLSFALLNQGKLSILDNGQQADQKVSLTDRWSAMQVAQSRLREHPLGLRELRGVLERAKFEIATQNRVLETTRREILDLFCFLDYAFATTCLVARPARTRDRLSKKALHKEHVAAHAALPALLDEKLKWLSELERFVTKSEDLAVDAEARSLTLPPADATDKLLRYDGHLDRQLSRAMDELERRQRQRRGEAVPPPLNINLGRGR
jgi:hypothetical protein